MGCSHQRWVEYACAIWMDPKITETRRRWLRGCHSMNDSREGRRHPSGKRYVPWVVVVSQRLSLARSLADLSALRHGVANPPAERFQWTKWAREPKKSTYHSAAGPF